MKVSLRQSALLEPYGWLQAVARFRQGAYRLLAAVFQTPTPELVQVAPRAAGVLQEIGSDVSELAFYRPVDAWLGHLSTLGRTRLAGLEGRHSAIFGGRAGRDRVPLLESEYWQQDPSNPGYVVATLRTLYSRAGLRLASPDGAAPDHISTELEFAGLVCSEEASAWEDGACPRAMKVLLQQRFFLAQHPCRWLPMLVRAVDTHDDELYSATARAAWAMVAHDVDFVRAAKAAAREAPRIGT